MSVLDDIILGVREDMARREEAVSREELERRASTVPPALDVISYLRPEHSSLSIIAECKRSSPSKGALADITDPAVLAATYERGGAAAISVLTEERRFKGSLADLDAVRERVSIPVLRKDFIVSPYQVLEARAHGADLLLLIVAALSDTQLKSLLDLTHSLGMKALVETHNREEARRALDVGAQIIGVNARNLKTLDVDRRVFDDVVSVIPDSVVRVAESGVSSASDVREYWSAGAQSVLVGEALVTSENPERTLVEFLEVARGQEKLGEENDE